MRRRFAAFLVVLVASLAGALPGSAAAALRGDILYLLPRESGQIVFLDLQALRASPHYRLIKQRMVPSRFGHLERFLRPMGVDVDRDLDWLAWVLVPPGEDRPGELFLGIAQGQFFPENVEQFFREQKLPLDAYRGQTLFPVRGSGAQGLFFTFLDFSTAAFGTRESLALLLETRYGAHESLLGNEALYDRVREVNGRVPVWAVLDDHYTRMAVRQFVPEAAKFNEFARLAERFRFSTLEMEVGRSATINFQVWCAEALDAQTFSLLLEIGLMAESWRLKTANPTLSSVFESADVRAVGERLQVRLPVQEEELQALLQRRRLR